MKKLITCSMMLFLFLGITGASGYAQTAINLPIHEGFNETTFPPAGWSLATNTNTNWQRSTSGANPTCKPAVGAGMAGFSSYSFLPPCQGYLISPAFVVDQSRPIYTLTFYLYRWLYVIMPDKADRINIYVSPTNDINDLPDPVATYHGNFSLSPVAPNYEKWYQYSLALDCTGMTTAYVIFEAVGEWGNNLFMDEIMIGDVCPPPTNLIGTLENENDVTLSWTEPETAPYFDSYKIYRDNTLLASNITETAYTDTDVAPGKYIYSVEAVYSNLCGASERISAPSITITADCPDATPPQNVQALLNNPDMYNVTLQWDAAGAFGSGEEIAPSGPFITHPGQGFNGADVSAVMDGGMMTGIDIGNYYNAAVADDFTLTTDTYITKMRFYLTQVTNIPFSTLYVCIYDGKPSEGGTPVWGDYTTNRVIESHFSNVYRIGPGEPLTNTNRKIMNVDAEINHTFGAGTYWVEITTIGMSYAIPVTIPGQIHTGNGISKFGSEGWSEWVDLSNGGRLGLAFAVYGVNDAISHAVGYNVYRDDIKLNTQPVSPFAGKYTDVVPDWGNYEYAVSAIWNDYCESPKVTLPVEISSPCETPWELPFVEDFEGPSFPPMCWQNTSPTNSFWERVTTGTAPTCMPISGDKMIKLSCGTMTAGKSAVLVTPILNVDHPNPIHSLSFYIYRNGGTTVVIKRGDKVNFYLSETPEIAEGAQPFFTVHRFIELEPVGTTTGWYKYDHIMNCSGMTEAYLIIEGVSAWGNNIFMDKIEVTSNPFICNDPENVNVTMNPYEGSCGAEISWNKPTTGGGHIFNIYRDDLLIASNITTTSYTDTDFTVGSHTWCVKTVCLEGAESAGVCATATCTVPTFTITASATTGGIINPQGNVSVTYGGNRSFSFINNLGYELKEVLVDGANVPEAVAAKSYTFNNVTANHTIQAVFEKVKYTITATAEENGSIDPMGEVEVSHGDSKTFTITADPGYAIENVLIDGVNNPAAVRNGSYTFSNVTAPHTISATFVQAQYTITATAGTGGSITPSGVVGASSGDTKTFFIVPNAGYKITQVLVDGIANQEAMNGSYTFYNIVASHTISATFEHAYSVITATAGEGGTIAPAGTTQVLYGQSRHYIITPHFGYKIATVVVDGTNNAAAVENGSYLFVNVTSDHSIAATFERITHTIVSEAGTGGSISPSGSTQVSDGESQTYTITENEGYTLTKVLVDGQNNEAAVAAKTYTFSNVTGNHTIRAFFEISKYTIEATAGENGIIAPTGTITVNYGGSKTYTFTPNAGYVIDKVLIDGTNDETAVTEGAYIFENVTENHAIEVSFKVTTSTITATVEGGNGTIDPEGDTDVDYGASQIYTFTPNEGYDIAEVLVDGVSKPGAVQNGSYTFNNVTTDHEIVVKFSEKTAIDEGETTTLNIYPNPTTGKITIKSTSLAGRPGEAVLVFDITGRLVLEVNNIDNDETTIDLSNYADGVYFIRVDGKTVKVVKR